MASERLFLAISPPAAVRAIVAELAKPLRGVRWTPADQLHITLRFLGDVDAGKIPNLIDAFEEIHVEPFILPVEGAGAFPAQRSARVLWVGVGSGHPLLHQLRQRIDDNLLKLGIDADLRAFHPHLTIGRCTEAAGGAPQWVRANEHFAGPSFLVDAFELFSSELHPDGAVHRNVARFPLSK